MSYLFLVILIVTLGFLFTRSSKKVGLTKRDLIIGWGIKLGFAAIYISIFTYYFSDGLIYGDTRNFLNDGAELTAYGKNDFWSYLELMFGFNADNQEFMTQHLPNTNIWSYGDNGDFINDNRLIIRINSIIHFFSYGNIWIHATIFAAISFAGSLLLFRTFKEFTKNKLFLYYGLLLFPTITFWGGGITKETILIFGLGLFFYNFKSLLKQKLRPQNLVGLLIGIAILLFNKPHVGLFVLGLSPVLVFLYKLKFNYKKGLAISAVLLIAFLALCFTPGRVNIIDRLTYKQKDLQNLGHGGVFFINDSSFCAFDYELLDHFEYDRDNNLVQATQKSKGRYKLFGQSDFYDFEIEPSEKKYEVYHIISPSTSLIDVTPINYSGTQLLLNTPLALANVFLRPLPNDPGDQLKIVSFIENVLFIILIGFVYIKKRKISTEERSWLFYLVILTVTMALIIGWSTPILGAVARYKIAAYLPLFIASTILLKPLKNESK